MIFGTSRYKAEAGQTMETRVQYVDLQENVKKTENAAMILDRYTT